MIKNILMITVLLAAFSFQTNAQVDEDIELNEGYDEDDLSDLMLFEEPIDDVVERNVFADRRVLDYGRLSEADIFWEKFVWGVIDVREKINNYFSAPQSALFQLMLDGISEGAITPYSFDNFKDKMTEEQINSIIFDVDTTFITNPDTYEQEMEIVTNEINIDNVKRFRIKEVWYFDKKSSTMRVRILGIAPILDQVAEDGETTYSLPMFWVYWPNARNYFARQKVYMTGNDATTLTWDDIIEMRFFNYYITKESNAKDRRLEDIPSLAGNDPLSIRRRLLASKKIKDEIFNFEQDLWSY